MMLNDLKETTTLEERLNQFGEESRARALEVPEGEEREALLDKARQSENALQLYEILAGPAPKSK